MNTDNTHKSETSHRLRHLLVCPPTAKDIVYIAEKAGSQAIRVCKKDHEEAIRNVPYLNV
jgi:hypothetical protein